MQNPISYLICATERTGSHLLGDALALTGIAGRPQECFHPARLTRLPAQADYAAYTAHFDQIFQESTTPNGVFGAKIQWWQLKNLVLKLREVPEYRSIGALELLQRWLPNMRYIRLTRRDKLRQAISHLKAAQTDVWWETTLWARGNKPNPAAQPTFDLAAIDRLMHRILVHETVWQLFFDTCGVQPLSIVYEDLVHDYAATARQVLDYLQIPVPEDLVIAQPRYKKQADDVSEQWVQRYHELKHAQGVNLRGAASIDIPQEDREIIRSQGPIPAAAAGPPLIQPQVNRARALRIVSYATQPLGGLPALLARCVSDHTPHTADCIWGGPPPGASPDPSVINWTSDPAAAADALADADVVLIHDGEVAPQHRALLANKAVVILAHHPHAQQSPWLQLGFPGAVLGRQLAELPAFHAWSLLPLPWESAHDWDRFWMPLIAQALPPPELHGNVVHRSPSTPTQVQSTRGGSTSMKITAYPLYDHATALRPAIAERAWITQNEAVAADLAMRTASGTGWELLCPYAFTATWNGGPAPEDIVIQIDAPDGDAPPFVQSRLGDGLLMFYTGYQVQTEGPTSLWIRGPINLPKDGLCPLEQIADTALLPYTVVVTWQCTRPHQTIRFAQGEPFGVLLPHPQHYLEQFETEVLQPDDVAELYEQELQQRIQTPAVLEVLQRLACGDAPTALLQPATADTPTETTGRWAAQLSDPPPVSCICPTYARVELLEEAIESFLRQDYPGQKELIILNDYDQQTLAFEHPEVRVVNVPKRFSSVGEKYQAAVALCAHDLIFVWDDDDIYLPHRLSLSVAQITQKCGFFKAGQAWFWNDGQLSGPERNTFHGGCCFSRELFVAAQGYPHTSSGFDIGFELVCEDLRTGATRGQPLALGDLYYIYRWAGTGSYHLSVAGKNGQTHDDAVAAYVQEQTKRGQITLGQITLNPHWKTNYTGLVRDYLSNGHAKPTDAEEPFPPPFFVIPGPQPMDEAVAANLFRYTHPVRISVVLPALNESVLLQRTVEQFQATLPANCEIIVVDNGSTDGSADFIPSCGCNGVSVIRSDKPLGVAGARNRGLEAARGEVIVFADAHIDIPEHWWQPVVATLNQPNVGVVGPGIGIMGKPDYTIAYAQRIAEPNLRVEWLGWKQNDPYPVPSLGGGFMAMRRETLEQAGGFDAGMPQWGSEDLELCVRYWLLGYQVWAVPEVTILHYFRKENPLKVKPGIVTHNVLRVALLHFNQQRIGRVVSALKEKSDFGDAMAHAIDSNVWQLRAEFAARRVQDDDWFFEQFKDSCVV